MSSVMHRKGQRESRGGDDNRGFDVEAAFARPAHTAAPVAPEEPQATVQMSGRNVEIPDHYRIHVSDKLAKLERYDSSIFRFDVQLSHENNPRRAKEAQRVEITAVGKGPVVRAQANGENFYSALEFALDKLNTRLRRAKRRREVSYGLRTPQSVAEATAVDAPPLRADQLNVPDPLTDGQVEAEQTWDDGVEEHHPGQVVRIKEHPAVPMTVDDALYEMELVGHDFFLFHDKETDKASVVYRRHAFDYGLIRLS